MVQYIADIPLSYRGSPLCSAWFHRSGDANFLDSEGIENLSTNGHPDLLVIPVRNDPWVSAKALLRNISDTVTEG